jgi:hypothetical protein
MLWYGNVEKIKIMRISRQLSPVLIMADHKQLEKVEYFNHLGGQITNNARSTHKIKSRTAIAKAAYKKKTLFTCKLDLHLRQK